MQKMPCKKKKYNSRFPPARIKKIMQSDDEVGKVAAVVPIIISRVLEIFVEDLLKNSCKITRQRNARTLTPAHIKATILQNNQLDFLKEIVSLIPDIQTSGDEQLEHYADYYSINASNNHNRATNNIHRQYSHPSTSNHNTISVRKVNLNAKNSNVNEVNQLLTPNQMIANQEASSSLLGNKTKASATSFPFNSNKRFTYSRSNSNPCTTDELINANKQKNKRKLKRREESTNYEDLDEEDEEDYELSSDEDELKSSDRATNDKIDDSSKHKNDDDKQTDELPSCSSTVSDDKLESSCKVTTRNKLDFEDDDYDV